MVCKNGHVDLLKSLRQNKLVEDVNNFSTKADGQNCLHLATAKNKQDMVDYLLTNNCGLASKPDKLKNETPIFYALSKHKSQEDRLFLMQQFLNHSQSINLNHTNSDSKTAYEAYALEDVEGNGTCSGQSLDRAA